MVAQDPANELFDQFTRLRRSGMSRDAAWSQIEKSARALTQRERDELIARLRYWETKQGRQYPAPPASDPHITHHVPPDSVRRARQQVEDESPGVIRRIGSQTPPENGAPAASGDRVACPDCGKDNAPDDVYCFSCGAVLVAPGSSRQAEGTRPIVTPLGQDAHFGENSMLFLQVQGSRETIRVQPGVAEMMIGRRSPDSVMIPDIDLSPYDAEALGVSRLHAALRRQDDTLVLCDTGSKNHTFVNGQRLHAHEVRVLHSGDEIRLGRLVLRVRFE